MADEEEEDLVRRPSPNERNNQHLHQQPTRAKNDDDDDDSIDDDSIDDASIDDDESGNDANDAEAKQDAERSSSPSPLHPETNNNSKEATSRQLTKKKVHRLSLRSTQDFNAKLQKRGVVYLARVPPRLTPTKIKKFLSEAGAEVTRVYLVEHDNHKSSSSSYSSGRSKKRYREGWIEFAEKKVAKQMAVSLNLTRMSNYKRSVHYDDVWNLKYLPKFKWSHLTEKVAYERRVQEQKLRLETMQAKKDTAQYKQLVETGQKLDKIQQRLSKKKRTAEQPADAINHTAKSTLAHPPPPSPAKKKRKEDKQTDVPTKKTLLSALV